MPGEDAVARSEGEGVERHVPRAGRVLDQGDLVALRADQLRERVIGVLPLVLPLRRRLVATDLRLALQVPDDGVDHLARRQ